MRCREGQWRVVIGPLFPGAPSFYGAGAAFNGTERQCRAKIKAAETPCWVTLIRPDGRVEETYGRTKDSP